MPTPALPPCIVIHGLDHARAALKAAQGRDIVLKSPSAAAALHGVEWWKRLLDRLRRDFPHAPFTAILDCGDCPGWAMAALRAEAGLIVLTGDGPAHGAVREAAEQKEAWGEGRWGYDSLDLLGAHDPGLVCREFLQRSRSEQPVRQDGS
jgi:hypothetical protein